MVPFASNAEFPLPASVDASNKFPKILAATDEFVWRMSATDGLSSR
jgi:hypothetical protein